MDELIDKGYIPSFCTACYRLGRTGEHFMEFSVPGFIKRYCTPNALLTMAEYLEDYAADDTKQSGYQLIDKKIDELAKERKVEQLREKINLIKAGQRDLYF
jgi:2-iminoacetate synthase